MIGAHQSSPSIMFTIMGSGSTVFMEGSSMVTKNTSGCNNAFQGMYGCNNVFMEGSLFFCPFDILYCESLEIVLHPPDGG
jgi:hypothetical protein